MTKVTQLRGYQDWVLSVGIVCRNQTNLPLPLPCLLRTGVKGMCHYTLLKLVVLNLWFPDQQNSEER